jgi:hypothetical protein
MGCMKNLFTIVAHGVRQKAATAPKTTPAMAFDQGVKDGQSIRWSPNKPRYKDPARDEAWMRGYYEGKRRRAGK